MPPLAHLKQRILRNTGTSTPAWTTLSPAAPIWTAAATTPLWMAYRACRTLPADTPSWAGQRNVKRGVRKHIVHFFGNP
jgi:hypothetical protein